MSPVEYLRVVTERNIASSRIMDVSTSASTSEPTFTYVDETRMRVLAPEGTLLLLIDYPTEDDMKPEGSIFSVTKETYRRVQQHNLNPLAEYMLRIINNV